MNICNVVNYLNQHNNYQINDNYYNQIEIWENWWRGFYKPFHEFNEMSGTDIIKRKLYSLKMAKKVCEDWASILLNEKTQITVDDHTSSIFLQGKNQTEGVLGQTGFWQQGNALIEKAFYSGTGAFVLKLNNMTILTDGTVKEDKGTHITLDYLTAMNIIPLTVRNGKITEAAFASEIMQKGKPYIYLETHELESDGYVITNRYFSESANTLHPEPLPSGIAPVLRTRSFVPFFSIVYPAIVNNIQHNGGMGISVFAGAIDNLMGVDLAYNNFCRDFKLGGKKVFYNSDLVRVVCGADGRRVTITPDDVMQQLFTQINSSEVDDEKQLIQEFNPSLRVTENRDGVQAQLDYLSFKCGFGTKHYQFNSGTILTATQYAGDKQELVQNASKHYIVVEQAIQGIVRAILWAGKYILGEPVNPDAEITITFDDGYIIDKESERERDRQDCRDGAMQWWEYRMKWRGEDEVTAKRMVNAAVSDDEQMNFGRDQ